MTANIIHMDLSALHYTLQHIRSDPHAIVQFLATLNPGDVDVLENLSKAIQNGAITGFVNLSPAQPPGSMSCPIITFLEYKTRIDESHFETTIQMAIYTIAANVTLNDVDEIYVSVATDPFAFEQGGSYSFNLPCNRISRPVDRQGRTRCPSEARGPLVGTRLSAARLRLSTILANRRARRDNVPRHSNRSERPQFSCLTDTPSEDFGAEIRKEGLWWEDPENQGGCDSD